MPSLEIVTQYGPWPWFCIVLIVALVWVAKAYRSDMKDLTQKVQQREKAITETLNKFATQLAILNERIKR